MAAPALCRAFSQNAWRRDLCSNCFRSKDEHKAAAAARQKTPSDAARLAAMAAVKSILKGPSRSSNISGKKGRGGVSFHKEESQVIGYGGDDEIHSEEEGNDVEEVETPTEEDLEREKAEQQELERLTKTNTDFNSVIANLQLESISQDKQPSAKGSASGIPVPGGRSPYTGALRLGLGSKDGDGNKKTLLVSVRPFGSDGEEVSKPVVKTKIVVTNGYGNATSSAGSIREPKDSTKPLVNGTMTNGYGLSSSIISKETSVKVNVSSSSGNESVCVAANVADSTWKDAIISSVIGNSDTTQVNSSSANGNCVQNGLKISEECEDANLSSMASENVSGKEVTPSVKSNIMMTANKSAAPIPANRSLNQQLNSGSIPSVPLKSENEKTDEENAVCERKVLNGNDSHPPSKNIILKEGGACLLSNKGGLNAKNKQQTSLVAPSSNAPLTSTQTDFEGSRSATGDNAAQHAPVPAERNITHSKTESPVEESAVSLNEAVVSGKAKSVAELEGHCKEESHAENQNRNPLDGLRPSGEVSARELQKVASASNERTNGCSAEAKNTKPNTLPSLQMSLSQPSKKSGLSRSIAVKQESQQNAKKTGDEPSMSKTSPSTKSSNNAVVTTPQKPASLAKRPAPSILKMGVPTGWHSKNISQKNSAVLNSDKDSNEDKITSEKANVVNGIIKTQPSTGPTVGQEKPLKPVNTIAKLRANFVNNNLKIIAESAAKIVNGTRYGAKNSVADEIPISKSSVMNLSMRPISTNSRTTNKSFHADDYELKADRVKGLSNLEKVSNSFPSIRAKGSGPDIRELLRTPEKENESINFQAQGINQKNPEQPGVLSLKNIRPKDLDNIELSKEITQSSDEKLIKKDGGKKEHILESELQEDINKRKNDAVSDMSERAGRVVAVEKIASASGTKIKEPLNQTNEMDLAQTSLQNKDEGNRCKNETREGLSEDLKGSECGASSSLQVSPEGIEDGLKPESPTKSENGLDKTPPGEKSRKKGIVRRILFKSGNEIYRKAGEMVRSVRRSNESKDDLESTRDTEVKDSKDLAVISKRPLNSKIQDDSHITAEVASSSEATVPGSTVIEEAINPVVIGIEVGLNEVRKLSLENTTSGTGSPQENVKKEINPLSLLETDEVKALLVTEEGLEKPTITTKPIAALAGSSQPPLMSPRPSFLHGKTSTSQPWSLQSPSRSVAGSSLVHSTPGARSERAASMSAVVSTPGSSITGVQRGRLSSMPGLESEGRVPSTNHNPLGTQVTLRKPGPIISGVKPAIPAKPSKILEATAARQGVNQLLCKPIGERKGSTPVSTPGSVGRSAGKRQAPKPPGMDASHKRKCGTNEIVDSQKEIITSIGSISTMPSNNIISSPDANSCEKQMENGDETCTEIAADDRVEESKKECAESLSVGILEEGVEECAQHHASQLSNPSNSGEEEVLDDSVSAPRGTHFVKNQALNASKSSSRVARETERRQMLIQLQSSNSRGPVPIPDGSGDVPSSILQATSNAALSARQRSASLGRGVGVASPRPPLPGGSLGRAAGEGAALSIVTTSDLENTLDTNIAVTEMRKHEDILSYSASPAALLSDEDPLNIGEDCAHSIASPVRSRSEGSLAVRLPVTPSDDVNLMPGAMIFDMPSGGSMTAKGEELIYDSPSGLSAKKKRHTVRGFLKFLRRGSLRDDPNGTGYENREEISGESEPKTRPVIVHPMELDGACVEVVKGGGIDVRRRLEEESALEMARSGETGAGRCSASTEQSQGSPRRPSSISIAPPRPPPVMHSPSSPSLSSSSSSSSGSTPIRPRPPPPPRGIAPVPPSPGGSGQKPARPPPPKPAHLMRLGLIDREVPGAAAKNSGDGIYANLGEVRATLAPCKPQRTASMREVLGSTSGKANGEAPTPRVIPRNATIGGGDDETETAPPTASIHCSNPKNESSSEVAQSLASAPNRVPSLEGGDGNTKQEEIVDTSKSDTLSWSVGAEVSLPAPVGSSIAMDGKVDVGADSSSEEENSTAPPLPLVPPPSLPPPLPLHPPPSPPSHATSSSSSSSIGNALILPEDSGYESVEFHAAHDSEMNAGRWWAESGIAASRGSVVTATTDSLEESYEAVVGANHRALADVLAQVCQPNPEEFGANTTLRWSDFLVEGPKSGILRSLGPISFHRAALKGRASVGGRDSWRRVTLGISASSAAELPQYFRGCICHDGSSASISRCMPSLRPLCTFQDEIPNRFFSTDPGSGSAEVADLIEATVMVFNPLHLYSLKTYLMELITERKFGQSFPPLPEESNWCNRACLFLLVLLDTLCSLECSGNEDSLCVIREEVKPSPVVAAADAQLGDGSHLTCPLPRLCVLPNENSPRVIGGPSPTQCFHSVVTQIAEATDKDSSMDSFAHVLNCIQGLLQGTDDVLTRSRAALELWFFGPPIFQAIALHSPGEKAQEELADARDAARWAIKSPILSGGEPEPLSVEGELLHATPRRWLDLERAGALRSLAVSALHRGSRIPSPLESGFEGSSAEEGIGVVGKCCRGWRVGEIGGHPTLPTCEEVRLKFLVGTSGSEVAETWELLARNELSSPTSVISLGRTYVDASMRKLTTWTISSNPEIGEAQC